MRLSNTTKISLTLFAFGVNLEAASAGDRYRSTTTAARYERASAPVESQLRKDLEWRCFPTEPALSASIGLVVSKKETVSPPSKKKKLSWIATLTPSNTTHQMSLNAKRKIWSMTVPNDREGTEATLITIRSDPDTWDLLAKLGTGTKQTNPVYWVCPYTLSKQLGASVAPAKVCGLSARTNERIEQCQQKQIGHELPSKGNESGHEWTWLLVTRTKELTEIWFQQEAALLWSSTIPGRWTFEEAEKLCAAGSSYNSIAAGIEGLAWRLPTAEELELAEKARIGLIFSTRPTYEDHDAQSTRCSTSGLDYCDDLSGRTLWSSLRLGDLVMVYDGSFGGLSSIDLKDEKQLRNAVKCVAEFELK
jgi:hypothetical protein